MRLAPDRRTLLLGLGAAGLAPRVLAQPRFVVPPLAPLRMEVDRITKITVCVRPFRAAGPRLDVERVAGKRVVHNYGHGGSGWSLSWGSAQIAAGKALEGGVKEVAVIGCGAIGLTTALTLLRAGAKVTIYAKDRAPYTRSARATGTWSPDSRVADAAKVDAAFPALYEQMARTSYAAFQTLLGLPGEPVAWTDRYTLFDGPDPGVTFPQRPTTVPDIRFFGVPLRNLAPHWNDLEPSQHPFPVARARHGTSMQFNVAELAHLLTSDFLLEGGRIETRTFNTPADLGRLKERVVVNCTGYGARALWRDETVIPVRGQITWLAPQPEVRYGLYYRHVNVLPRPDGIVVQYGGDSEMWGYGSEDETPDLAEAEASIRTIAPLFEAPKA
ncbi:FAD-dependent oxidoreductase [Caulobacter sp. SLTY]|uniref:FAD-dependent oxidoreductase n=1 Tax=Caulobacter sp. SLTY TaxID=2683262 RepID=UPI0014132F9B|nr:FAD-dependent oxidoreductase [Caulobacter sp. SLTY]NBB13997.1 FAD-dependent oxidoreductase [Caulobacter sp. SLTY]